MLKLYIYRFCNYDVVQKHIFEIKPVSKSTVHYFILRSWAYSNFYGQDNVCLPCSVNQSIIPEMTDKNEKHTMSSLEKYAARIQEGIDRTIEARKKKMKHIKLSRESLSALESSLKILYNMKYPPDLTGGI